MSDGGLRVAIVKADARALPLPDESVDCVVTSPPYWSQRKYDIRPQVWDNRNGCAHDWGTMRTQRQSGGWQGRAINTITGGIPAGQAQFDYKDRASYSDGCACGAWRGQLGLEPTPALYISHLVEIFREVRRVLKPSGTCWIVVSDSRPGGNRGRGGELDVKNSPKQRTNTGGIFAHGSGGFTPPSRSVRFDQIGLKPTDTLGLPHDLVKALRADGWYWRDEIIWAKTNGMPESVSTRTTRAHEYIFLLTKSPSPNYFFDYAAIREPITDPEGDARRRRGRDSGYAPPGQRPHHGTAFVRRSREGVNPRMHQDRDPMHPAARKMRSGNKARLLGGRDRLNTHMGFNVPWEGMLRRKRSVWTVSVSKPRGLGAHYATFPEKLIEPMILGGCPVGGIVLDPFAGSGTTGVVARRLGRKSILCDLGYQEIQQQRLALDGPPAERLLHDAE